jgi:hypothetical protein
VEEARQYSAVSKHQRYRDEAEAHYPRLSQFLGGYLHEDWPEMHGTPEAAVDKAISEYPIELRRTVRKELADLLARMEDNTQLRSFMEFGLGVWVYFKKPAEARSFAEEVERKLLSSIQSHFEHTRRQ